MRSVRSGHWSKVPPRAFGPLRIRSLTAAAGSGPFSVHHIRMAPRARHPPLRHAGTSEFFLVLEGDALARIGGRRRRLRKGSYAFLPPGTVHEFRAGEGGLDVLAFFCPPMDLEKPDIILI